MIGICIVFLISGPWGKFLAQTAVDQICRHTRGPHRIYGYALRADDDQMRFLSGLGLHSLITPDPTDQSDSVSREHANLLDRLTTIAFEDGCTAVATFDMDSWPTVSGWDVRYAGLLTQQTPVVAMVRTELGDNFPFAAFTLLDRTFWEPGVSSFSSRWDGSTSTRPSETGSGILDRLNQLGLSFFRLEKTNEWIPHPIIGAVYDDSFFHLGAGSRTPHLITDAAQYALNGSETRKTFGITLNGYTRDAVLEGLRNNHDEFISQLIGGRAESFVPILSNPRQIAGRLPHTARSARARINAGPN